jgi:PPOX class probable F420-dependent enzyme
MEPIDIVAGSTRGVLATVKQDGHPQLSHIYYLWDPDEQIARITTTADRVKARVLRRNPAAALYVSGSHFYAWAVAEGDAEVSDVTTQPGDAIAQELLPLYETFMGAKADDALFRRLIDERRLVIRLRVTRVYGMALETDPSA